MSDSGNPSSIFAAKRVAIIGAGNVATHLSRGLAAAGCKIISVYSRTISNARRLADEFTGCYAIDNLDRLDRAADLYLIAVADAAVASVAAAMPDVNGLVAHTSGSIPLDALAVASQRHAVLYPLQTFTREAHVDLDKVPFFTEASTPEALVEVDAWGAMISRHILHADSTQRKTLHIAGVLSCNFVNYLWDCTAGVLARDGYDFSVVEPLVRATLEKAVKLGPHASQTGPAMRCDAAVMREHMSLLDPQMADIYLSLSKAILKSHNLNCEI